jgi:hypothetical protein
MRALVFLPIFLSFLVALGILAHNNIEIFTPASYEIHEELCGPIIVNETYPSWSIGVQLENSMSTLENGTRTFLSVERPFVCLPVEMKNESLVNRSFFISISSPPCTGSSPELPRECTNICQPGLLLPINETAYKLLLGNFTVRLFSINNGDEIITKESIATQSGQIIWSSSPECRIVKRGVVEQGKP